MPKELLKCSFCGRGLSDTYKLVMVQVPSDAAICEQCILAALKILVEAPPNHTKTCLLCKNPRCACSDEEIKFGEENTCGMCGCTLNGCTCSEDGRR